MELGVGCTRGVRDRVRVSDGVPQGLGMGLGLGFWLVPEGLGIGLGLGLGLVPEGYCRAEQRRIELLEEVSTHLQAPGPH